MRKICSVLILSVCCLAIYAQQLTVASFNIRYDNKGDAEKGNGWAQRAPVVCQLIQFHDFDIFGAQEVLHNQLNDMLAGLPEYGYIGVGRDDGKTKGEYAPIFYKKDKFKLLRSGHFWLSPETGYPNKGWDAALPRICTWGEFETEGKQVWFFNLHMDHVGVEARRESAKLVLSKIKEMCGNDPVIFTGDFNVDQNNESYTLLHDSDIMDDSYEVAKIRYALNGTFNSFHADRKTESRIDHIFVSPSIDVLRYGVLTDTYRTPAEENEEVRAEAAPRELRMKRFVARTPSDHFPIMAVIDISRLK